MREHAGTIIKTGEFEVGMMGLHKPQRRLAQTNMNHQKGKKKHDQQT
ncbi:hypothetical protein JM93_02051 [Roseibium hamelinense]|uniref:Uncharacterized protein n=1 Tax=Roseibium hamelinense TaxID=150831 RepID=A0A562T3E3_9HYPH|nr:hypothetical protein JM93_02051 [Roseibium hamelinense]